MYINPNPNSSGAYPAPQSNKAPGLLPLTEEQSALVVRYNGFVTITETEDQETGATVYSVEPNVEAWGAWKASLPPEEEPAPTLNDRVSTLETDTADLQEALNMILTGVTE